MHGPGLHNGLQLWRIKLGGRSGLLTLSELWILRLAMRMVIRLAITGEILYERDSVAGEEMRVWELKQHFCIAISSDAYFAWQLSDDYRLLQDHYLVANVAKNVKTKLSLLAIKRRLRSHLR